MSKPEKVAPIGTCDYCGKGIPVGEWWTSKGRPRLHCSLECRQAANSRKMENRSEWMRERIESGDWEIELAWKRCKAKVQLQGFYDPKGERIKA